MTEVSRLKTRNLNAQFAYAVSRNEMTEDTRHNGVPAGLPFERVSQEITFPTHKQLFVFTLLSSRAKPRWQLLAADNSAHSSDTELLIVFLSKVPVPPCHAA